jgi:hypothetical protein
MLSTFFKMLVLFWLAVIITLILSAFGTANWVLAMFDGLFDNSEVRPDSRY